MRKITRYLLVVVTFAFAASASAQTTLKSSAISSGGSTVESESLTGSGVVGQPTAGFQASSSFRLGAGFVYQTGPFVGQAPNIAPTASPDEAATATNRAVTIDVLANDFDLNGDDLLISGVTDPSNGTATNNRGSTITYEPARDFTGQDQFQYQISDGRSGEATAKVTVTVLDATQVAPIAALPSKASVQPAEIFRLNVVIGSATQPVTGLFAAGFKLGFDPDVLEAVEVRPGGLLGTGNPDDIVFFNQLGNLSGQTAVSVSRKDGRPGADGSGVVATVDFRVRGETAGKTTSFSFTDMQAVDADGAPVALQLVPGEVSVRPLVLWPGDTNNDGIVNATDVLPVGQFFDISPPVRTGAELTWSAQTPPAFDPAGAVLADATGDGLVSQNDIIPVGLNFGQRHTGGFGKRTDALAEIASIQLPAAPKGTRYDVAVTLDRAAEDTLGFLGLSAAIQVTDGRLSVTGMQPGSLLDHAEGLHFEHPSGQRFDAAYTRPAGSSLENRHGDVLIFFVEVLEDMERPGTVTLGDVRLSYDDHRIRESEAGAVDLRQLAVSVATDGGDQLPTEFSLGDAYPNPFNPRTQIEFALPSPESVNLSVYNAIGRRVSVLVDEALPAGRHAVTWEAGTLPSGLYVFRMEAGAYRDSGSVVLLK